MVNAVANDSLGAVHLFYRLYFLDVTGRANEAIDLEADDDDAAILEATKAEAACPKSATAELWQGARLICKIKRPDRDIAIRDGDK